MTPNQQRVTIAKACGYTERLWNSLGKPNCHLPDYLNDLNAMHEAEKTAGFHNPDKGWEYRKNLFRVVNGWDHKVFQATASQRAEAFLRTIGKWKGGEG
jgi:hypothetical protein